MKKSILVCLVALLGLAASTKFFQEDYDVLEEAVGKVRAEIVGEREADERLITARTRQRDQAKADYDAAEVRVTEALAAEKKAKEFMELKEKELKAAQTQFALGEQTRTAEETALGGIKIKMTELQAIGNAEGSKTLGKLPPAPAKPTEVPELAFLQEDRAEQVRDLLMQLQRGYVEKATMDASIGKMETAIEEERKKDQQRVDDATKARDDAVVAYQKAVAHRQAEELYRDQMKAIYETAVKALAHDTAEVAKAEEGRKQEEQTLTDFLAKVVELFDIRKKAEEARDAEANPAEVDLQVQRANGATETLKETLQFMEDDVRAEEKAQRELMERLRLALAAALKAKEEAQEDYELKTKIWEVKTEEYAVAVGEFKAAEKALADERSVARQERQMINELRDTVAALSAVTVSKGNCPIVNGAFCSNAGSCEADDTCKCNPFHDGANCEFCQYGYTMQEGICVPSEESMMSLLQYNAKDVGQILLSVKREGTAAQMSGVEKLLVEMETKLDQTEAKLVGIRDTKKAAMEAAEAALKVAKKNMDDAYAFWQVKIKEWETAKQKYDDIVALFNFEQPIRDDEYKTLAQINELLAKLESIDVYEKKENPFEDTEAPVAF